MDGTGGSEPNRFELRLGGTAIVYSTTGLTGQPQLTYDRDGESRSWSGDEIGREETTLGALVTVLLDAKPDLQTDTLSLLLPEVHLPANGTSDFKAVVLWTVHRTSKGGPKLVEGPIQIYTCVETFHGTAQIVAS
ncbi:MAG TPA: hypothetical protein VF121_03165 [Thermoanaerobaculia bacterium]|nr:hypothetical protein [Thermoanaerobaculia bacterium]